MVLTEKHKTRSMQSQCCAHREEVCRTRYERRVVVAQLPLCEDKAKHCPPSVAQRRHREKAKALRSCGDGTPKGYRNATVSQCCAALLPAASLLQTAVQFNARLRRAVPTVCVPETSSNNASTRYKTCLKLPICQTTCVRRVNDHLSTAVCCDCDLDSKFKLEGIGQISAKLATACRKVECALMVCPL